MHGCDWYSLIFNVLYHLYHLYYLYYHDFHVDYEIVESYVLVLLAMRF